MSISNNNIFLFSDHGHSIEADPRCYHWADLNNNVELTSVEMIKPIDKILKEPFNKKYPLNET